MRNVYFTALLLLYCNHITAQALPLLPLEKGVPQINTPLNRIAHGKMYSVYKKLAALKNGDSNTVSIIHFGDSHLQPDFIGAVLRDNLQAFFGNAGRGLIFPHQLAKSNMPLDITASSNISWTYNRIAHPEIPVECGIAGFCIKSNRPQAKITIGVKNNSTPDSPFFNQVKIFTDTANTTAWMFEADSSMMPVMLRNNDTEYPGIKMIETNEPVNSFTLTAHSTGNWQSFYGASVQNGKAGVLLHTIGVNGARYEHFNNSPILWQQLPALHADLVIVSLGTNEAQAVALDEKKLLAQVLQFTNRIQAIFPGAAILITTPQDSYKRNRPNLVLKHTSKALAAFCQQHNFALWDLHSITNGYGSSRYWYAKGLLNKDKVHFTAPGYKLQGKLLYNALANGYNNYIKTVSEF